eukprot:6510903-Prymnesium_polylepis.1
MPQRRRKASLKDGAERGAARDTAALGSRAREREGAWAPRTAAGSSGRWAPSTRFRPTPTKTASTTKLPAIRLAATLAIARHDGLPASSRATPISIRTNRAGLTRAFCTVARMTTYSAKSGCRDRTIGRPNARSLLHVDSKPPIAADLNREPGSSREPSRQPMIATMIFVRVIAPTNLRFTVERSTDAIDLSSRHGSATQLTNCESDRPSVTTPVTLDTYPRTVMPPCVPSASSSPEMLPDMRAPSSLAEMRATQRTSTENLFDFAIQQSGHTTTSAIGAPIEAGRFVFRQTTYTGASGTPLA